LALIEAGSAEAIASYDNSLNEIRQEVRELRNDMQLMKSIIENHVLLEE
jgi:hypothetical protein